MGHDYDNPYSEERINKVFTTPCFVGRPDLIKEYKSKLGDLPITNACNQLFLWAALTGRDKLADYLWKKLEYPIAAALIATHLLIKMSEQVALSKNTAGKYCAHDIQQLQKRSGLDFYIIIYTYRDKV